MGRGRGEGWAAGVNCIDLQRLSHLTPIPTSAILMGSGKIHCDAGHPSSLTSDVSKQVMSADPLIPVVTEAIGVGFYSDQIVIRTTETRSFALSCSNLIGEFDPGSGRTLAACLTHASRTGPGATPVQWRTGA